ncbi:hypothetical protein GLOIN_2v1774631 [Rhizophagus clarus]|uniref:DUF659 domain-containing protein n=1 Tax=Rhizophagus clarus TaxID=94130 RepID=A0A8H3M501_9GLOM|nr:hypothetical protein GLOIN_2v1774631 [Rhizophagus clarus]
MPVLEEHLTNYCSNAPTLILRTYMAKVRERVNISNKKRKADTLSNFVKELNATYNLPSQDYLSLEEELTDLLIAALDGWILDLHTATYLTKKIEDILEQIGPERIFAIVSDNAANINILASFFHNSHLAGAKFNQLIKESGIKGGGLKSYCKTRWTPP